MILRLEGRGKIDFFTDLYKKAKAASSAQEIKMERWIKQYKGDLSIDPIDGNGYAEPATHCRNITYELIESQVSGYIPVPCVKPKMWSEIHERNAKSIETLAKNKRDELGFERMNDMDERYSPIYGGSVRPIEWDNSVITHRTVGDVKVTCLSPTHFCGQPGIFDVEDMEYCFILYETTKEEVMRRYHVSLSVAEETESEDAESDETATVIVCYYKDEDDTVCKYVWSGDRELEDTPDYYARKRRKCTVCGKREELCTCEKPKYELQNEEYEELDHDIVCSDGRIIPRESPVIEDGMVVYETVERPQEIPGIGIATAVDERTGLVMPIMEQVQVPKMRPTRLPFYKPKRLPIVIRKNTSEEDSVFGQSDCEFIRPQQQAINKLESIILQRACRSGVMPKVPKGYKGMLTNSNYDDVLEVENANNNLFGVIDLQVDLTGVTAQSERHYDHAKRIVGISDSFQGQYDASAQSGRAKEIQAKQSEGRLQSKKKMKDAAYADMDRVMFELYLAYADEPRPCTYKDAEGRMQNVTFNRYDFLEQDEAGEWYYNDEYLFSADGMADVERSRDVLWAENRQNFQSGAYGNPQIPQTQLIFWQNMERAHYPYADENVERIRLEIQRQAKMEQVQTQMSGMESELEDRKMYEEYLKGKIGGNGNGI